MSANPQERALVARIAAHQSWAQTADRSARTAPAREGLERKFLDQAGGDVLRAGHLRKAHFARLALKSAQSRRKAREARETAAILEEAADAADRDLGPSAA